MNADRLLKHYDEIMDAPDAISRLRRFVLDLAVRGKLVPQDPAGEAVSISKIQQGQAREKGENANAGTEGAVVDGFDLPSTWKWTRLSSVLISTFYGPRFGAHEYIATGTPTIRTTDMTSDGRVILRNPPRVAITAERMADFRCLPGDLLVTRTGSIGTMAVFDGEYPAVPSAYLIRMRFSPSASPHYVYLALKSTIGQTALGLGTTKVAQPNINARALSAIAIPLPPLTEQHRIVAKVDELMALCDGLEASLAATATIRRSLLDALLADALAPAEDRELKAAE
jgi:hypothetical protein